MFDRWTQRPAHSLARRLLYRMRSFLAGGTSKTQQVYFVDRAGMRLKRVVFADSYLAEQVARSLRAAPTADLMPRLVLSHERELWVEYVDGRPVSVRNRSDCDRLAAFYARLYQTGTPASANLQSQMQDAVATDLWFLGEAGVLKSARVAELVALSIRLAPSELLLGFDYVDPVAKNFLVADERLRVIDIESLQEGQPLGTGLAKAAVHWTEVDGPAFREQVFADCASGIRTQYPYVQLCFLAAWTKRKLLSGKQRYVRPELFDALIADAESQR